MRAAVSLVIGLAACGRIGFDATGDGEDIPDGDPLSEDAPRDCGPAGGTTFPGGPPCAAWGASPSAMNATLSEVNGTLAITPTPNRLGAIGSCRRDDVPLGVVEVEISEVLGGTTSQTGVRILASPEPFELFVEAGALRGAIGGVTVSNAYDAVAMRWLRIRASEMSIAYEFSSDGEAWTELGFVGISIPGAASVEIFATTPAAEASPGTARFETVRHCNEPPAAQLAGAR